MSQWIKQSTAITIKLGPFVDSSDGSTAMPALVIAQADIRLSKNGGDLAQSHNVAGATHDESGYYDIPLDTTDTNTLGRLLLRVTVAGALPVWKELMVCPANVWDSMFGADKLDVDAGLLGVGAVSYPVTITDDDGLPLDGCEVWLTTDEAGINTVVSGITDALGLVTFSMDPGTYYLWRQLAGFNPSPANPVEVVVA